jgi:hypothetical protein
MHGLDTQATQLHRHTAGHNPAPLHGLNVLEGETALAVVLVRTGQKVGGMLFGEGDEARTGVSAGLQCEVHYDLPLVTTRSVSRKRHLIRSPRPRGRP